MIPIIDVSRPSPLWDDLLFDVEDLANDVVARACLAADIPARFDNKPIEVSIVLADDDMVQNLNHEYRDQNKPTNVLSFPAFDIKTEDSPVLGDIIIAFETLKQEAENMEISPKDHYTHLLIHGTLHLLGYDHIQDKDAEIMESLEIDILSVLGIENPYSIENFMA